MNEEIAEQLLLSGFKTVVLMGDHGGGQAELKAVAEKLDAKHAGEGKHVYFCDEVYAKANADFDEYLKANNFPVSQHAGHPGHLRDAVPGRGQGLGPQGPGGDRAGNRRPGARLPIRT